MDWDAWYRPSFRQNLQYLAFSPKPVQVYTLRGHAASLPSIQSEELLRDGDVLRWLDEVSGRCFKDMISRVLSLNAARLCLAASWMAKLGSENPVAVPTIVGWDSYLTIRNSLLSRAPPNEFELKGESSGDSLRNIGLSKDNFIRLIKDSDLQKSFVHALEHDRSMYSYQHLERGVNECTSLS